MKSKILLMLLIVMAIAVTGIGWKAMSISIPGVQGTGGGISLSTNPTPLRIGKATFLIDIKDKNGKPVDNATVSFDINMTNMNMGTQQGTATPLGDGRYSAVGNMSMRGPWRVRTNAKMPDGSTKNKDFTLTVI